MNLQPTTDFNEPYSSVSFRQKQPTSPYPYSSVQFNQQSLSRWCRIHKKSIIVFTSIFLILIYMLRDVLIVYWYFFRIKMNNTMFDHDYVPCGLLRKDPTLFVQDSQHVQVIWEINCGMKDTEMILSYWSDNGGFKKIIGPIQPTVLDLQHTVYKATIGPLENAHKVNYVIEWIKDPQRKNRKKQLAKYGFDWFENVENQPIRIAAMADNQFGMLTFSSLLRQIQKLKKQPHFLLHAGDAVQNYPSLRQWQTDFIAPLSMYGLSQVHPIIYAHGNHDFDSTNEYVYTRSLHDPWFAFSLANHAIRFIVLDSNIDWELQDTWLKNEIQSPEFQQAQFRIVIVHVPPFLEYWDPEAWFEKKQSEWGAFIKDRFVPLFEEGGVDLVISGHQHNYERGERNGIHYAIIGGAGGDIDFDQVHDWGMYEAKLLDFHFVMMEIRPPSVNTAFWSLQWDTFNIKGQKVDSVTLDSRKK